MTPSRWPCTTTKREKPIFVGQLREGGRPGGRGPGLRPRAAHLYRLALALLHEPGADRGSIRSRLANTLSNLGRGLDSAREYLASAEGADPAAALTAKRKAAFQYCISGHVDQGRAAFREVLRVIGIAMPDKPIVAAASVLVLRAWLRLRGPALWAPPAAGVRPEAIDRLDTLRAVSVGISVVDPMGGPTSRLAERCWP